MDDSRPAVSLRARALYLIVKVDGRVIRTSMPLPGGSESRTLIVAPDGLNPLKVQVKKVGDHLRVDLSSDHAIDQIFAKIERLGSRVFIYDASGWHQVV